MQQVSVLVETNPNDIGAREHWQLLQETVTNAQTQTTSLGGGGEKPHNKKKTKKGEKQKTENLVRGP